MIRKLPSFTVESRGVGAGLLPGRNPFNCGTCRIMNYTALMSAYHRPYAIYPNGQVLSSIVTRAGEFIQYEPRYFNRKMNVCPDYRIKSSEMATINAIAGGRDFSIINNRVVMNGKVVFWYVPRPESKELWINGLEQKKPLGIFHPIRVISNILGRRSAFFQLQKRMNIGECNRVEIGMSQSSRSVEIYCPPDLVDAIKGFSRQNGLNGLNDRLRKIHFTEPEGFSEGLVRLCANVPMVDKDIADYFPDGMVINYGKGDPITRVSHFTMKKDKLQAALANIFNRYSVSKISIQNIEGNPDYADVSILVELPGLTAVVSGNGFDYPLDLRVEHSFMPMNITEDMESSYNHFMTGFETEYVPLETKVIGGE